MKAKKIYRFSIGRGGRFYNGGHKTFNGEFDLNDMFVRFDLSLRERDHKTGKFCFMYEDSAGSSIISAEELKRSEKNGRIILDFDGQYDTEILTTLEMMTEEEIRLAGLERPYIDTISDELIRFAGNCKTERLDYYLEAVNNDEVSNKVFDLMYDFEKEWSAVKVDDDGPSVEQSKELDAITFKYAKLIWEVL